MVDAGFVWDATVMQYPELERVELPELEGSAANLSAGVLESAPLPAAALRFARWLAAAKGAFERAGFRPAEGDAWTPEPRLLFHAGAMLRPAIEKTVAAFERREGCRVDMVYNGCGILVAQMKAGDRPDLYFSCDEQFMKQVQDLFERPVAVSLNQLVVLVKKGNPFGVRGLEDLGKPGLRVGIGHEQQCALGVITQETLLQSKLRDRVMRNVVVQVPAGDMLVNQMKAGTLDAVVAYVSNAAGSGDVLEALPVDLPCALAVQPLAVGRASRYPHLAGRLAEALRTPGSRRRFEQEGFRWKAAP
jgi:ABC-type molybdate transport system substrate-binding protein